MPDLFTMGHWHAEIPSNVTFGYCTKGCIGVVVLRGRLLIHGGSFSIKDLNQFIMLFLSFSSRKLAGRVHKGNKVRWFKGRHT